MHSYLAASGLAIRSCKGGRMHGPLSAPIVCQNSSGAAQFIELGSFRHCWS